MDFWFPSENESKIVGERILTIFKGGDARVNVRPCVGLRGFGGQPTERAVYLRVESIRLALSWGRYYNEDWDPSYDPW